VILSGNGRPLVSLNFKSSSGSHVQENETLVKSQDHHLGLGFTSILRQLTPLVRTLLFLKTRRNNFGIYILSIQVSKNIQNEWLVHNAGLSTYTISSIPAPYRFPGRSASFAIVVIAAISSPVNFTAAAPAFSSRYYDETDLTRVCLFDRKKNLP
jgi:hypothetical protein